MAGKPNPGPVIGCRNTDLSVGPAGDHRRPARTAVRRLTTGEPRRRTYAAVVGAAVIMGHGPGYGPRRH